VKVFHGCRSDILWLQKDFGIFVVNCFDTFEAAKLLQYPALSLAHLLKYYCKVTVDKKHQLADWRVRPLSDELLKYAREDTHYLLYIYDCLRKDILAALDRNGLSVVFEASKRTCLLRYTKEVFTEVGYFNLFQDRRAKKKFDDLSATQDSILRILWNWRDNAARKDDESVTYIMSNSELIRMGTLDQIPSNAEELRLRCEPLSAYVRSHLADIFEAIKTGLKHLGQSSLEAVETYSGKNMNSLMGISNLPVGPNVRGPTSGIISRLVNRKLIQQFTPIVSISSSTEFDSVGALGVPPVCITQFKRLNICTHSPKAVRNLSSEVVELEEVNLPV
jgi:ribonuclease D